MITVLIEPRPTLVPGDTRNISFSTQDVKARNNASGTHTEMTGVMAAGDATCRTCSTAMSTNGAPSVAGIDYPVCGSRGISTLGCPALQSHLDFHWLEHLPCHSRGRHVIQRCRCMVQSVALIGHDAFKGIDGTCPAAFRSHGNAPDQRGPGLAWASASVRCRR